MPLPDRPMRVTMVNKYYWPPHLGGVETHLRDISEGLVDYSGAQVRAIVCNESAERAEETIGGVDVVRLPRQFALSSAPIALSMQPRKLAATRWLASHRPCGREHSYRDCVCSDSALCNQAALSLMENTRLHRTA